MAYVAHPLQNSATITVNIPTQTLLTTTRKTALTAAKIVGILTIGVGIGYLIAIKTVKMIPVWNPPYLPQVLMLPFGMVAVALYSIL